MDIEKRNRLISLGLWVVIFGLGYLLFDSIYSPYQLVVQQRAEQQMVRDRMEAIRDALIAYQRANERFPESLDQLVEYLKTDPNMVSNADSLFRRPTHLPYDPDAFTYTPRDSGNRFLYALNDTLRPQIYLLNDPDSEDRIGSLERTTLLNAANWD